MSNTIWLISEDKNDYRIVRAIIAKLKLPIHVAWGGPTKPSLGISKLAAELKKLIMTVQKLRSGNDCIVVLHDADLHRQPKRDDYNKIRDICKAQGVKLVIAHDELEAWLLSDSGICAWLKESVKTWNGERWPSDHLRSTLHARYKLRYPRDLDKVLVHLNADGTNQSFRDALAELQKAPCITTEHE